MQVHLDPWQQEILDYDGHILLCTGRRVGKTLTFAIKAAQEMLKHKNWQVIVVSLTEDQAELIIAFAHDYLRRNHKDMIAKGTKRPTKKKIMLKNGSFMLARPVGNTGDAVRGFNGNILIIDEASRMPEVAFTAITPILLTTGGKLWICSTPFGRQGYFYKCWQNKHDRFKIWHKQTEEVIKERKVSPSWIKSQREDAIQYLEEERGDKSALEFGQEYEGRFIEEFNQFFPDKLIHAVQTLKRPENIARGREHYLGVDIGRMGDDPSAFEVIKRVEEHGYQVEHQITRKTTLTQTASHIFAMNVTYDFRKIYVDDEGIGIGVFDMLISDDETKRKVEGLKNSKKIIDYKDNRKTRMLKVDLYMNLLKLMEQGKIHLLDDPAIFLSLKSIQYEYTKDKKGQPFLHIFGNDNHITEGLIRAAHALKAKSLKPFIYYI